MKTFLRAVLILLFLEAARAEDITTREGTVYKSATVTGTSIEDISVTYRDGVATIPLRNLPADLQQKYRYDPAKIAAFKKEIADEKAAQERAVVDAKDAAIREQELQRQNEISAKQARLDSEKKAKADADEKTHQEADQREKTETYQNLGWIVLLILLGIGSIYIYFLPTIVANRRGKRNRTAIFILNLCLGWILIPWIIALVWAYTNDD